MTSTKAASVAIPKKRTKLIAGGLVLLGLAFVIGSLYFAVTPNAEQESGSYLKTAGEILVFLLGAGTGIKGWLDLIKKDKPATTIRAKATDSGQAAVGKGARNVRAATYVEQQIFQVAAQPVIGPPRAPLNQLPPAPADFTGREHQIEQILSDFENHKGATISGLTGMGGIGKTALGLVVANNLCEKYPDAQIFLDLKGTTAPLSALDIIRHVILSFDPAADLRALDQASALAAYQSLLHGKKVLIFLDNARSAEQIDGLSPSESCGLLVTSRWSFTVPGLKSHRVDVLGPHEAEEFLRQLCPRLGEKAAELAAACGHLPLALRIAGSFLLVNRDRPVKDYLDELNDRKHRLPALHTARVDTDMGAEPDLLATFELSYSQLNEDERKNWRMLGVFPAPFAWGAAAYLWELEEEPARKLLGLLCRYSLLDYNEASERYDLHDLLADYAQAQLKQDEGDTAQLRHSKYYLEVLRAADELYLKGGDEILRGLQLLDFEWEHIRTGQAWASQNAGKSTLANEVCAGFSSTGNYCRSLRLPPRQRIKWLDAGLIACRAMGDRSGVGAALNNLGLAYANLGEAHKAIEFYGQALVIDREIGDRLGEGAVLGNLGIAYKNLGEAHKAIEHHERALVIDHEIGDRRGEGNDLGNLGIAYKSLGDVHKAIEFYGQALEIAREIGDRRAEGAGLGNLGLAYSDLGETHKAIQFYEEQLTIVREIGDRRAEGGALGNLGLAYSDLREMHKAIQFYEKHVEIAREIGDRLGEGNALGNLGNAYAVLGEAHKAIQFYEKQLTIAREIGDRLGEGNALANMGIARKEIGDTALARQLWNDALKIYVEIDSPGANTVRKWLEALK